MAARQAAREAAGAEAGRLDTRLLVRASHVLCADSDIRAERRDGPWDVC